MNGFRQDSTRELEQDLIACNLGINVMRLIKNTFEQTLNIWSQA
jgi:hypothetical protein